jgi:arylsulfatase A-like enzyme
MQLAGVSIDKDQDIDGRDLSDFLFGKQPSPVNEMSYERGGKIRAFRKGDWKIILAGSGKDTPGVELYNLKWDISEKYNVADQYPEITEDLLRYLE